MDHEGIRSEDENTNLPADYMLNYVFKKLSDTIERYRSALPDLTELEKTIRTDNGENDIYAATLHIMDALKDRSEESGLIGEILKNIGQDVYHGVFPKEIPRHMGKYYIDTVTD